jgi:hypothetical protein
LLGKPPLVFDDGINLWYLCIVALSALGKASNLKLICWLIDESLMEISRFSNKAKYFSIFENFIYCQLMIKLPAGLLSHKI